MSQQALSFKKALMLCANLPSVHNPYHTLYHLLALHASDWCLKNPKSRSFSIFEQLIFSLIKVAAPCFATVTRLLPQADAAAAGYNYYCYYEAEKGLKNALQQLMTF